MKSILMGARIAQIRWCTSIVNGLSRLVWFHSAFRYLLGFAPTRLICHSLVGYRRPFSTLSEASAYASRFLPGHEASDNIRHHLEMAEKARVSDYAALFFLRDLLPNIATVLDLGGNVGNLFYCYSRYLEIPRQLNWIVCDLPTTVAAGRDLAQTRGEHRLSFTNSLAIETSVDLLIVSGALHYFDEPLSQLIAKLSSKPKYIIINRTPLVRSSGRSPAILATVQDAGSHLVACKVLSVDVVISDLERAGYKLMEFWDAPELSLNIPFHPELSAPCYTGMYWRLASSQP
ncbi:MAG: hypothetical protein JWP08_883 [Bryobacterales bacterium]|nr:hypothetical protein [Bryobacterales bacterium]